jgi:hypothetical protein
MSAKVLEARERQKRLMFRALELCESPIEEEFLIAVHEHLARKTGRLQFALDPNEPPTTPNLVCRCIPQFQVPARGSLPARRVDFLFLVHHKARAWHYATLLQKWIPRMPANMGRWVSPNSRSDTRSETGPSIIGHWSVEGS